MPKIVSWEFSWPNRPESAPLTKRRTVRALGLLLSLMLGVHNLIAQTYSYQVIAKSGQTIGGVTLQSVSQPSLNNNGVVAFINIDTSNGATGVFTPSTIVALTGQTIGGKTLTGIFGAPWINSAGHVSYMATYSGGTGVFVDASLVVATGQVIGGQAIGSLYPPAVLDDSGGLLFDGNAGGDIGQVFTATTFVTDGGGARKNNAGQIVYVANGNQRFATIGLGGATYGAGSVVGGKTLTGIFSTTGSPSVNNASQVGYWALFSEGGSAVQGIFVGNSLVLEAGQLIGGVRVASGVAGSLSLNDSGTVVSSLPTASRGSAVFTQSSVVAQSGQIIGSCSLAVVSNTSSVINNAGQVAFGANCTDGSTAIILATPSGVVNTVTLVDPVPQLLNGPQITTAALGVGAAEGQPYLGDMNKGRVVKGVATDGVAQVVIRIPATSVGEQFFLTVRPDQCVGLTSSGCIDEYGLVFDPLNPPPSVLGNSFPSTVITTAPAIMTSTGAMAFAAYRAPLDFVRSGLPNAADQSAAQRSVAINITSLRSGALPDLTITLVRPPVILIHGLWSSKSTWDYFSPLVTSLNPTGYDQRFWVARVDYWRTNAQGFYYNATLVLPKIEDFINNKFNITNQVAAVQADIVAHSMGGDIVRMLPRLPRFLSAANFYEGVVHKLITIDTPHFGSQFASNLLTSNDVCQANWPGSVTGGAINDLAVGSVALRVIHSLAFPLRSHAIAGFASDQQVAVAQDNWTLTDKVGCPSVLGIFGTFASILGPYSDLIVSVPSQWDQGDRFVGLPLAALSGVTGVVHSVDPTLFTLGPDSLSRGMSRGQVVFMESNNGQLVINLLNTTVQSNLFASFAPIM